nr:MAG TPA: hypothetical protein [Caudoviricetes sp.]
MIANGLIYLELINAGDVKILVEKYPPRTYYTHYRRKDGETDEELFKRIMERVCQMAKFNWDTGRTPLRLPIKQAREACGID